MPVISPALAQPAGGLASAHVVLIFPSSFVRNVCARSMRRTKRLAIRSQPLGAAATRQRAENFAKRASSRADALSSRADNLLPS